MSSSISVFIVDDEKPVLEGFQAVIEQQTSGFHVAGTCLNGKDALEQIRSIQPDLILMDINMPGLSGVEVMRELRSSGIKSLSILVTAYERFDIAREAFGLGIYSYLLKPVTPAALINVLEQARVEIDSRRARETEHLEILSRAEKHEERLELYVLSMLAAGVGDSRELLQTAGELGIESGKACIHAIVRNEHADTSLLEQFLLQLGYSHQFFRSSISNSMVHVLISASEDAVRHSFAKIWKKLPRNNGGDQLSYCLGQLNTLADLPISASRLMQADFEYFHDASLQSVVDATSAQKTQGDESSGLDMNSVENIEQCLLDGNVEAALFEFSRCAVMHEDVLQSRYFDAIRLVSVLNAREHEDQYQLWIEESQAPAGFNLPALERWLRTEFQRLADTYNRKLERNPLIRDALHYLEKNYKHPFGLEDAAEYCEVSPQHLSKSFSQHMGISFIDYLTRYRVKKSLDLMNGGSRSIRDIAESCGYPDANYFARIFKKLQGITPSQYIQNRQEARS